MGKYESKEKTQKIKHRRVVKSLLMGVVTLVGAVVITLLGLLDYPHTGRVAYGVGVFVIFLVVEAGTVIYGAIRKRKEKESSPGDIDVPQGRDHE